jgi:hypothetical protein
MARPRPGHSRHAPRMRGIQYAAASRLNHRCLWNVIASEAKQSIVRHNERMDCFASLAMTAENDAPSTAATADMTSRSRDMKLPEVCIFVRPLEKEGAGKTGCALHPRSRVQCAQEVRTRAYRSSGEHPAFPAQWFYGVLRALPGVRIPLATVIRGLMDEASPVGPTHPPRT